MKHKLTIFAALMMALAIPHSVKAYDFSAMNAQSNYRTLYYNIITDSTVEVTDYNFANRSISGLLKIPSSVSNNGHTYSVTRIYGNAFSLCENITSLIIPETIQDMGESSSQGTAFQGCINIVSIQVDTNNPIYDSRNNCNAIIKTSTNALIFGCKTTIVPSTVECIGYGAFSHCSKLTSISLPNSITKLGPHSFSYCNRLKTVHLPDGIDTIGYMAFMSCDSLEEVTMQSHVKSIGSSVFEKCLNLTNIVLSDSITTIPYGLFKECTNLPSVVIPGNVSTIGQRAFELCSSMQSITLPFHISKIDKYTFNGCSSLQDIIIPVSVTQIEDYAFQGCSNLQAITIPDSVNSIGKYTFAGCTNVNITSFGKNLCSIDNRAFYNCDRIVQIIFPKRLKTLGQSCFSHCDSLTTVIMYDSLELIDGNAFNSCPNLTAIYISTPTPPSIGIYTNSFQLYNYTAKIYVPCGTKTQYATAWGYSVYSNIFTEDWLPYSITTSVNNPEWGEINIDVCSPTATLTAIPEYGYHFVQWADGALSNPRIVSLFMDTIMSATFEETFVSINHSSNDTFKGVTIGVDSCRLGDNTTIAAVAYSGFKFSHWSNGVTDNPYTLAITQDTTIIALFSYIDTIFVNVLDTTYIDVPYAVHDTTIVVDTLTLTEYVPVHDTTYINVHDTTFIDVPYAVHDTTIVVDTLTLTEYVPVHDTTYINIHDTAYIDVPYAVHDTTIVVDTLTLTEYVPVHDTTYINIHDTTYITLTDTVTNTIYDTITNTVFDTVTNTIHDTTVVYSTDTLWLHDTVFVHDTIYIYDTVYVGMDDVETISAKIYTSGGQIVVDGADGNIVWLYDVNGRVLATKQDEYSPLHFIIPASGAYLVKVGNHPARKVVVIR